MDCSPLGSAIYGIFPSKNTGVGCHALLQGIFLTQRLNPHLLNCRQIPYLWATRETHIIHQRNIKINRRDYLEIKPHWKQGHRPESCLLSGFRLQEEVSLHCRKRRKALPSASLMDWIPEPQGERQQIWSFRGTAKSRSKPSYLKGEEGENPVASTKHQHRGRPPTTGRDWNCPAQDQRRTRGGIQLLGGGGTGALKSPNPKI